MCIIKFKCLVPLWNHSPSFPVSPPRFLLQCLLIFFHLGPVWPTGKQDAIFSFPSLILLVEVIPKYAIVQKPTLPS